MQQAKKYGVDHYLLFSNSAPVQFTKNGKAFANAGEQGCNLSDNHYGDFANFLTTTTKHFIDEGYNITLISPVNEPQYDWTNGQEGSPWTNECISRLVRELDASIAKQGIGSKILLPEACQWKALYMDATEKRANNQIEAFFNPANTNTYIGDLKSVQRAVAGHSYWTFGTNDDLQNIRNAVADKAAKYDLEYARQGAVNIGRFPCKLRRCIVYGHSPLYGQIDTLRFNIWQYGCMELLDNLCTGEMGTEE